MAGLMSALRGLLGGGREHEGFTEDSPTPFEVYGTPEDGPSVPEGLLPGAQAFLADPLSAKTSPPVLDHETPLFEVVWDHLVETARLTGIGVLVDMTWTDWNWGEVGSELVSRS